MDILLNGNKKKSKNCQILQDWTKRVEIELVGENKHLNIFPHISQKKHLKDQMKLFSELFSVLCGVIPLSVK